MFGNSTSVVPTTKFYQVEPLSVEYSKDTEGGVPAFMVPIAELAALAVNSRYPGLYSHTLQMLGISSYALITSEDRS